MDMGMMRDLEVMTEGSSSILPPPSLKMNYNVRDLLRISQKQPKEILPTSSPEFWESWQSSKNLYLPPAPPPFYDPKKS